MLCPAASNLQPDLHGETTTQNEASSSENADLQQQRGPYDVICGRHKDAFNNIGNRRFRITVALSLPRYKAAATRKDKSIIIHSVAALVRSNGGRFLQRQKGAWVQLDDKMAHEKVGHALRDMASKSNNNNSSTERNVMSPSATLKEFAARWKFPMNMKFTNIVPQSEYLQQNAPMERNKVAEDYEYDDFSLEEEPTSFDCADLRDSITSNLNQEQQQIHLKPQGAQQYTDESLLVTEFEDPSDLEELLVQNVDEREQSSDDKMISWMISESPAFLPILDTV